MATAGRSSLVLVVGGLLAAGCNCDSSSRGDGGDAGHQDRAPVADPGADRAVEVGEAVALDGRGSSDPDGDPLGYRWTLVAQPDGGEATLAGDTSATATFRATRKGPHRVRLVVSDGTWDSAPAEVQLTARNRPPTADAGAAQAVWPGEPATFDGTGSSDPDPGDVLAYHWSLAAQPDGGDAALAPDAGAVVVVATVPGTYQLRLVVDDGTDPSAPAPAVLTVRQPNRPPTALVAVELQLPLGQVRLDGTVSTDPDGDPLRYRWTLLDGGGALSDPTGPVVVYTADLPGTATVLLSVQDGDAGSETVQAITFGPPCRAVRDLGLAAGDGVLLTTLGAAGGEALPVLCDQGTADGGWTLLYKKSAGNTPNAWRLWTADGGFNASDAGALSRRRSPDDYDSPLVTRAWPAFVQARVELVVDGGVVKSLDFDLQGSDPQSWFVPSRHTAASWSDLPTSDTWQGSGTGRFFSIQGTSVRTWYLNSTWPGCTGDLGWMLVSQDPTACPWDALSSNAVILYSVGSTIGLVPSGTQFAHAEALLVWGR